MVHHTKNSATNFVFNVLLLIKPITNVWKSACSGSHKSAVRKTILIMKLSVFFLLLAMRISAANYGQKNTWILKESNIAFGIYIKRLKINHHFLYYSNDVTTLSKNWVSINVLQVLSLDNNVMEKVLEGTGLHWKEINQNRVVKLPSAGDQY